MEKISFQNYILDKTLDNDAPDGDNAFKDNNGDDNNNHDSHDNNDDK